MHGQPTECMKSEQNHSDFGVLLVRTKIAAKRLLSVRIPNAFRFWHSTGQWNAEIRTPEIGITLKSKLSMVWIFALSDFSSSGFNEHGAQTERSVSTIKA